MDQYDRDEPELFNTDYHPDCYTEPHPSHVSKYQSQLDVPDLNLTLSPNNMMLQLSLAADDPYDGPSKIFSL